MADSYFPIKTGVACPLKWSWNTVRLSEATSACCHRVDPQPLTEENFADFHNLPIWIEHRKLQLQGKFPQQGCQHCEEIESHNGISDRLFHSTQTGMTPWELDQDPQALVVTPRVLEIFINNACNMSCIYCDESNSTRILKENKKFGYDVPGSNRRLIDIVEKTGIYQTLLEKLFQWLDKNYQHLNRLNVLGGEPFYQKEFFRLIDYIFNHENKNLNFTVITNLMVSRGVLEDFVDKAKHALTARRLNRVDITASIDCFGPEQEYVRYGLDLDQWMSNFEYLASHKWLYLTVNNTMTSLTIKTLPDLLTYVNQIRKHRRVHHAFSQVTGRRHLHPAIFGSGYFDQDFDRILSSMLDNDKQDQASIDYMKGIIQSINQSAADFDEQRNLRCYLNEIDRRRGTDWRTVFPWLAKDLDNVV